MGLSEAGFPEVWLLLEIVDSVDDRLIRLKSPKGRLSLFFCDDLHPLNSALLPGDFMDVVHAPYHPAIAAMEDEAERYFPGFYNLMHLKSGVVLRAFHQA